MGVHTRPSKRQLMARHKLHKILYFSMDVIYIILNIRMGFFEGEQPLATSPNVPSWQSRRFCRRRSGFDAASDMATPLICISTERA